MEVVSDVASCPLPAPPSAVTIGAYDGVHLGHQAVVAGLRSLAERDGLLTCVVTFDRHPASVVRPTSAPKLLTDLDQRLELLDAIGVDRALVVRFDEARASEPAERFVEEVLVGCAGARAVVVGEDFHFGNRRRGDVALLRSMGADLGFAVAGLELVGLDGLPTSGPERVSSTGIRLALAAGDLAKANAWLGRPHEVRGLVAPGDRRARQWGFPTANVEVPEEVCLPADGIYAGWYLRPDGERRPAALSLGRRPTFYVDAESSLLEAHILDFDGDLYGEPARVQFVERLRGEVRFERESELVEQIAKDCLEARELLSAT